MSLFQITMQHVNQVAQSVGIIYSFLFIACPPTPSKNQNQNGKCNNKRISAREQTANNTKVARYETKTSARGQTVPRMQEKHELIGPLFFTSSGLQTLSSHTSSSITMVSKYSESHDQSQSCD